MTPGIYSADECRSAIKRAKAREKLKHKEELAETARQEKRAAQYASHIFHKYGKIILSHVTGECLRFSSEAKMPWTMGAAFITHAIEAQAKTISKEDTRASFVKQVWDDLLSFPTYGISKVQASKAIINELVRKLTALGYKCDTLANVSSFGGFYFRELPEIKSFESCLEPVSYNFEDNKTDVYCDRLRRRREIEVSRILIIDVPGKFPLLDKVINFVSQYFS